MICKQYQDIIGNQHPQGSLAFRASLRGPTIARHVTHDCGLTATLSATLHTAVWPLHCQQHCANCGLTVTLSATLCKLRSDRYTVSNTTHCGLTVTLSATLCKLRSDRYTVSNTTHCGLTVTLSATLRKLRSNRYTVRNTVHTAVWSLHCQQHCALRVTTESYMRCFPEALCRGASVRRFTSTSPICLRDVGVWQRAIFRPRLRVSRHGCSLKSHIPC